MLSIFAKLFPKALAFLGKLGRGKATIAGDVIATVGGAVVASPHVGFTIDANVVAALHEIGAILVALGTLVSSFGFGRKANDAAKKEG